MPIDEYDALGDGFESGYAKGYLAAALAMRERCVAHLLKDAKSVNRDAAEGSYAHGYRLACENNAASIAAILDLPLEGGEHGE